MQDDDLVFNVCLAGGRSVAVCGREITVGDGEALLLNSADVGVVTIPSPARYISLRVPSRAIAAKAGNVGAHLYRPVRRDAEAIRLLAGYARMLRDADLATRELQTVAVEHVYGLITLALGATREAHIADGGVRAARLAAIRTDALANLSQVRLSPKLIGRRHSVSERYVHLLFAETGETFGEFVTAARMTRARDLLCDPAQAHRRIADIAQGVGYGDLSTFNRAFRRRFGDTPSGVRGTAP